MKEERDVYVPMRDGVKLATDIFRPDAPRKFPALLAMWAYGKDCQSVRIPESPTPKDIDESREQIDPRQKREAILANQATWYCGKCLAYCPVAQK